MSWCPTVRRFMENLQKALALGDWSRLTSWNLNGQQVYDPCASLQTPACREPSPRIMDMYIHQTILSFANNLVYSKYVGWLSAEASTRVGVGPD